MKRLLVGLLLAAGVFAGARAEPPGSPDFDPRWMPPTRLPGSPAAHTANDMSRVPGDARPGVAVPQLSIPFKRTEDAKANNPMRSKPVGGGIDDSVAQCRAKRTAEEREACERALSEGDAYGR
jgi:hypothetical protein